MSAPKTATLERELRRIQAGKIAAWKKSDRQSEDWLYGAEVALSWALGMDVMAPAKAFAPLRAGDPE